MGILLVGVITLSPWHKNAGKAPGRWSEVSWSGFCLFLKCQVSPTEPPLPHLPHSSERCHHLDHLWQFLSPGHLLIFLVPSCYCLCSGPRAPALTAGLPASDLSHHLPSVHLPQLYNPILYSSIFSVTQGPNSSSSYLKFSNVIHLAKLASHSPLSKSTFLERPCPVLSQLRGFAPQMFLSTGRPPTPTSPKGQPKCCLLRDVSKPRWGSNSLLWMPALPQCCLSFATRSQTPGGQETLTVSSQHVVQGMVHRRQQDSILNLGTAPSTSTGSSLERGSLSSQACHSLPHRPSSFPPALINASLQSLNGGDQIRTTLSLEPPIETGQTSNTESEWDKGNPEWFFFLVLIKPNSKAMRYPTLQIHHGKTFNNQHRRKNSVHEELIWWCSELPNWFTYQLGHRSLDRKDL